MSADAAGMNQPCPDRRTRLVILGICSMSLLIVGLDATIVNVALPAIHRSFHSALSGLQWTIDAYTLVIASFLMLSGSTADRLGRRRVFQSGLALFSFGSLLCAVAPSLGLLIAARVVQAIGGSMLNPVAMSIIRNVFEDPRERAQAIGVLGRAVRHQHGAGTGGRRRARRLRRVAGRLHRQPPRRTRGDHPHRSVRARVPRGASAAHRPGGPGAGHRRAGHAHLRDHPGPRGGLAVSADDHPVRRLAQRLRLARRLRAPPPRASPRGPVLPQRTVLRSHRDRDRDVHGDRWLPLPQHAVSPERPRPLTAGRRPLHPADGGGDDGGGADLGTDRRQHRDSLAAGRRQRRGHRQRRDAHAS